LYQLDSPLAQFEAVLEELREIFALVIVSDVMLTRDIPHLAQMEERQTNVGCFRLKGNDFLLPTAPHTDLLPQHTDMSRKTGIHCNPMYFVGF
jgi:hypothetical protein